MGEPRTVSKPCRYRCMYRYAIYRPQPTFEHTCVNVNRANIYDLNNQLTINAIIKDGKMPSLGYRPASTLSRSKTYALPVSPLGELSKRLRPRVEVNPRGLCALPRRGQLFCLAHTGKIMCMHLFALMILMSGSFSVLPTAESLMMDVGLI